MGSAESNAFNEILHGSPLFWRGTSPGSPEAHQIQNSSTDLPAENVGNVGSPFFDTIELRCGHVAKRSATKLEPDTLLYQETQDSLKERAYQWFRQHPMEKQRGKIKRLADSLGLNYDRQKGYLWHISSQFKTDVRNRQGLKPPNWHNWLGKIVAFEALSREEAVMHGWTETKAKNHYLLWRDPRGLGRLEWHLNGTIKVWVRKPVTEGKKLQLLANAFFNTWLFTDIKVFADWAKTLRHVGNDCAVHVGFDPPYFRIDLFKESNGVTVVGGDKSHRDCTEFRLRVPEWAEEYRQKADLALQESIKAIERFTNVIKDVSAPKPPQEQDRRMVV